MDEWQSWLIQVISPEPLSDWNESFRSSQGLSRRHNILSFLYSFYAMIGESDNPRLVEIKKTIVAAIKQLG